MAHDALPLPPALKNEAEKWAARQGITLDQFILWAVAEKVGALNQRLDDPQFPDVTYRRGASGHPQPVLRGTGVRVQTIVIAAQQWGWAPAQIAAEYGLPEEKVDQALAFYASHRQEIDLHITLESTLEPHIG